MAASQPTHVCSFVVASLSSSSGCADLWHHFDCCLLLPSTGPRQHKCFFSKCFHARSDNKSTCTHYQHKALSDDKCQLPSTFMCFHVVVLTSSRELAVLTSPRQGLHYCFAFALLLLCSHIRCFLQGQWSERREQKQS